MLRSRIFWRLFAAYGLLLAIALGAVGWLIQRRVETHLVGEMRRKLEADAQLVQQLVLARASSPAEQSGQVVRLARITGQRITLIAADGAVLADSAAEPAGMDNHLDRPEVRMAQLNGVGSVTRFSDTVQQNMFYTALRTDHDTVRYVRLALPMGVVENELHWLAGVIWTAAGLTLLGALVLLVRVRFRGIRVALGVLLSLYVALIGYHLALRDDLSAGRGGAVRVVAPP